MLPLFSNLPPQLTCLRVAQIKNDGPRLLGLYQIGKTPFRGRSYRCHLCAFEPPSGLAGLSESGPASREYGFGSALLRSRPSSGEALDACHAIRQSAENGTVPYRVKYIGKEWQDRSASSPGGCYRSIFRSRPPPLPQLGVFQLYTV